MAKTIRVNLPLNKPDDTLALCKRILQKHTDLGAASPITGFTNMTIFGSNLTAATALRTNGNLRGETREAKYELAGVIAGLGKGQTKDTKDTVYWNVQKVRNALQNKFKGTEESLSEWGFSVVVTQSGAKRNVRIRLPLQSPDDMIKLGEDILAQDTLLGAGSPLAGVTTVDLAALGTLTGDSRTLLNDWATVKGEAQSFHNQAMEIIGYGAGQTTFTAGTLYFDICQVRDRLLDVYQGHEEALSEWGFDVVVRVTRKRKKGASGAIVREGDLAVTAIANIVLGDINPPVASPVVFSATGSIMRFYASLTAGEPIQPTTAFFDVQPGQNIEKSIAEMILELGFGGTKAFLNVQNIGPLAGHWMVTIG